MMNGDFEETNDEVTIEDARKALQDFLSSDTPVSTLADARTLARAFQMELSRRCGIAVNNAIHAIGGLDYATAKRDVAALNFTLDALSLEILCPNSGRRCRLNADVGLAEGRARLSLIVETTPGKRTRSLSRMVLPKVELRPATISNGNRRLRESESGDLNVRPEGPAMG